jgi:hypothetical protein
MIDDHAEQLARAHSQMRFFSGLVVKDLARAVEDYAPTGTGDSEFARLVGACLGASNALKNYVDKLQEIPSSKVPS